MKNLVLNYYMDLFSAETAPERYEMKLGRFPPLRIDQHLELEKDYTTEEIWEALKRMGPLKAPGLDGFPALFFQRTWHTTRPALVDFVKKTLERSEVCPKANESLLVLIPKEENPLQ